MPETYDHLSVSVDTTFKTHVKKKPQTAIILEINNQYKTTIKNITNQIESTIRILIDVHLDDPVSASERLNFAIKNRFHLILIPKENTTQFVIRGNLERAIEELLKHDIISPAQANDLYTKLHINIQCRQEGDRFFLEEKPVVAPFSISTSSLYSKKPYHSVSQVDTDSDKKSFVLALKNNTNPTEITRKLENYCRVYGQTGHDSDIPFTFSIGKKEENFSIRFSGNLDMALSALRQSNCISFAQNMYLSAHLFLSSNEIKLSI